LQFNNRLYHSGFRLQDLKTGHLLGVSPVAQFYGQLIGSVVSIAVSIGAYALYQAAYGVPSSQLPAPTARVWVALARLVNGGSLPIHSAEFCVAAAVATVLVTSVALFVGVHRSADGHAPVAQPSSTQLTADVSPHGLRARAAAIVTWLPNPVAFAIGMYVSPSWTVARIIGAGVAVLWMCSKKHRPSASAVIIMLATGLVLGEGLTAFIVAGMAAAGVRPVTCSGCIIPGQCGNSCA
jgi:uncharacterized oligopeptide transporter (OPT) family protein